MSKNKNVIEPRYLLSVCCLCGKEYGRKPLPEGYGKDLPARYQTGDLISHGYCPSHFKELAKGE